MRKFRYEVGGKDGSGQVFSVAGDMESAASFPEVTQAVLRQAFQSMTQGQTNYGSPGVGGCRGPYHMERILIEVVAS